MIKKILAGLLVVGLLASIVMPFTQVSAAYSEVASLRDQYSRTIANWDGSFTKTISLESIHYKDNYGNFQPINTNIVPSSKLNWDWEVTTGHWELFIKNDTTVGVKKDNNWIGTRLHGIAYYETTSKDYTILQTTNPVTPVVSGNTITWYDILYGVDYVLHYTNDSLKEEVIIHQEARDLLSSAGHRPSDYGYFATNTYLVPIFECDWSQSLPMKLVWEGIDFEAPVEPEDIETNKAIYFEASIEDQYFPTKLVSFLPVYMATSVNPVNPGDPEKEWEYATCIMKKRLVKKNDKHWLLTGVPVLELNSMPEGSIVFDPTETLRPDAAGDETNISTQFPAATFHWDKVDEAVADEFTTYVGTSNAAFQRDLYNLPASSGAGVINKITVYARCYVNMYVADDILKIVVKSGATVDESANKNIVNVWTTYSEEWALNPDDSEAWEWADIDDLQIGISLMRGWDGEYTYPGLCTQVYVVIDYTSTAPPTDFVASDNLNDRVTCTWTKTVGATKYQVYRDGAPIGGELGDVDTWDDMTAGAPTITPGNAVASDGTSTAHIALSIAGEGTNNGTTYTYKVRAWSAAGGWSGDSNEDTGKRIPGALTYDWQRSSGDADGDYGDLAGAHTEAHNDTTAPAPTITAGNAVATDGDHTDKVALSLAGTSSNDGAGRWYRCVLDATGCAQQTTGTNRGYRDSGALSYQWQADRGEGWGNIAGATGATHDDVAAPAGTVTPGTASASDGTVQAHSVLSLAGEGINDGATNDYRCNLTAPDAVGQTSGANTGFRRPIDLTYQWYRSSADADEDFALTGGATTDPYNDTGFPADGSGRYVYCEVNATGAVAQDSTHDRGYRSVPELELRLWIQWEYNTIFHDGAGVNDATPSFRTASTDADVVASAISFQPVEEAKAPAWTLDETTATWYSAANVVGNFTTTPTPTYPGADVIEDIAAASGTPAQLPFVMIYGFITLALSLSVSYVLRQHGSRSLFVKVILISGLLLIGETLGIIDFWMLLFYLLIGLAIMAAGKPGSVT